jgi:glycosyltransferase involved in cell wall biosynthesis
MNYQSLQVSVPWSLSHYIPLNGYHPLYRALFDHAPDQVVFSAWDNVKLYRRIKCDVSEREKLLSKIKAAKCCPEQLVEGSVARKYKEQFWVPNKVLTSELDGDIEFHHTAPFPSLKRPFVLHCESFAPVFFPFTQQGGGSIENAEEIRRYYRSILADPLCLGIFSHIPETLQSLSIFFSDPAIDCKLFPSRIGLSEEALRGFEHFKKPPLCRPRFLFVNSANQDPENFFRRGGHIVLRFWNEFLKSGCDGSLMMRCARPIDQKLVKYGIDIGMVRKETGRTIIWGQDYLTNDEMNALMASANFFLLPSMSLHSVSIMQAMNFGTIPVVTDTVGTSVYVTDGEHGVVLKGMRDAIWSQDEGTGVLVDSYQKAPSLDDSLVRQLTERIHEFLNAPDAYEAFRKRTLTHGRDDFSGRDFSKHFWSTVKDLFQRHKESCSETTADSFKRRGSLIDCTIQGEDWGRVFESPTHPMLRINTGRSKVFEMGGAMIHAYGNLSFELNDWSVLAKYSSIGAPQTTFSNTLEELGGSFLYGAESLDGRSIPEFVGKVSRLLKPYPALHSAVAFIWKKIRPYYCRMMPNLGNSSPEGTDIELILHGIKDYNIIRCRNQYFAILQNEGAFIPAKFEAGGHSSCFASDSLEEVIKYIDHASGEVELILEGFHGFNIVRHGGQFHAILQSEGAFVPAKLLRKEYSRFFSGSSIDEVKNAIVPSQEFDQTLFKNPPITSDSERGLIRGSQ